MNKKNQNAEKLARKIQKSFLKKKPVANWIAYSRLHNLGYSHNEIITKNANNKEFFTEADLRKENMRQEYLKKLLY